MAITYTFRVNDDLLIVEASGFDEGLSDVMAYGDAVIEAANASSVTRVLCDERNLEYRLDTVDTYKSAEYIAEHAPRIARIAIVTALEQSEEIDFWETVMVNRGMTIRVFTNLEDARTWLAR